MLMKPLMFLRWYLPALFCHTSIKVPLGVVFEQVSQSYKNDPEALHRFSYYLLLHAKSFAKNINSAEDAEIVNLAIED